MRGYSIVALDRPKYSINVGGIIRAVGNYDAAMVVIGGRERFKINFAADTMHTRKHKPILRVEDLFSVLPHDCVPVAVELLEGSEPLPDYKHPERAFYVFGAEDATLGKEVLENCRDVISVPTQRCMNLACTVSVVLYDRLAKQLRKEKTDD